MSSVDVPSRFEHHPPTSDQIAAAHVAVRHIMAGAAREIDALMADGREKSVALTKLEEAMFWANAGIARSQRLNSPPNT